MSLKDVRYWLGDVIGVVGNPLEDLRLLQHVSFVMKEGKVFKTVAP